MKSWMLLLSGLLAPALLEAPIAFARPLNLSQVMTPSEQKLCGVTRLRPSERQALQLWLTRYTARVRALAMSQSGMPKEWGGPAPGGPGPVEPPAGQPPLGGRSPATPPARPGPPPIRPISPRQPGTGPTENPPTDSGTTIGEAHSIDQVEPGGAVVILDDGSRWEIAPADQEITRLWLPATHVKLVMGGTGGSGFPCTLVNTDDNEKAIARYRGRE